MGNKLGSEQQNRDETWRVYSGRADGSEGYQFGDFARSVVRRVSRIKWKESAARTTGGEGYNFGDITRSAVRNLFGDREPAKKGEPQPPPLFREVESLSGGGRCGGSPEAARVWLAFFNATYAVGRLALKDGELDIEVGGAQSAKREQSEPKPRCLEINLPQAVEDMAPPVVRGLPTLALVACAVRSIGSVAAGTGGCDDDERDGITLSDGTVLLGPAAAAADIQGMFGAMRDLARCVARARLSPLGLATLRGRALAGGGAGGATGGGIVPGSGAAAAAAAEAEVKLTDEESAEVRDLGGRKS